MLQPGCRQVAAGYVIYGSSVMMVYTTGEGVAGFTLDPTIGEFLLSHPQIVTPRVGKYYSVNESNFPGGAEGVQRAVRGFHGDFPERDQGEELALHRLAGGRLPPQPDRRRGLPVPGGHQEHQRQAPAALRGLADGFHRRAGRQGSATDGVRRILDIVPASLHQRTPLVIGSREDVGYVADVLRKVGQ